MSKLKTKLSVNINKIATLRNARGGNEPSVLTAAQRIQSYGAHGITVHPRPDQRHIRYNDVFEIKPIITTEFNIEGYPDDSFIKLVLEVKPDQVTLVPDPPHVLTSNAGWNVREHSKLLKSVLNQIHQFRVSVFIDPKTSSLEDMQILKDLGAHRIELYTADYAEAFENKSNLNETLKSYTQMAEFALKSGLRINAGHDLNQKNLSQFLKTVPEVSEVSIGHALISEALYEGLETTVKRYLNIINL